MTMPWPMIPLPFAHSTNINEISWANINQIFSFIRRKNKNKITGTTNTPEYYINMRTGTHYFPRGVNGVAAVERSRQKFGLNKIDEAAAESTVLMNQNSHRRTESCDLGRRLPMRSTSNHLAGVQQQNSATDNGASAMAMVVHAKDAPGYALSQGLSPDLHRHLAYQNYKGMECKCSCLISKFEVVSFNRSSANGKCVVFCVLIAAPSPRQRCRIRTNPWFSNVDPVTNACITNGNKKMDADTSSTSSGCVKSGTDESNQ